MSLARVTDGAARFWVGELKRLGLATGQQRSWTRTIDSSGRDTYIVLAWSDPPGPLAATSQGALVNDLTLTVELEGGATFWRGNNFNENLTGVDDGYSHPFLFFNDTGSYAINTVEAVFLPAGALKPGQRLTIRVTGSAVPQGPQTFALYAYNVRP